MRATFRGFHEKRPLYLIHLVFSIPICLSELQNIKSIIQLSGRRNRNRRKREKNTGYDAATEVGYTTKIRKKKKKKKNFFSTLSICTIISLK